MMWLVTLIVLALLAWFAYRMIRRNADTAAAARDSLEHDRDGLNQPLPGQRAATDGEVHDAARSHVGGHLEEHADASGPAEAGADGGMHRVEASVRETPDRPPGSASTGGDGAATLTVPGSPDPSAARTVDAAGARTTDDPLDADVAARAARESANTGGTGTAVLAGIATAAGAAAAGAAAGVAARDGGADHADADAADAGGASGSADANAHADVANAHADASAHVDAPAHADAHRVPSSAADAATRADASTAADTPRHADPSASADAERDGASGEDEAGGLTNPPDPETAGALEPGRRRTETTSASRDADETLGAAPDRPAATSGAAAAGDTPTGERDPARDDARTNAPIGDTTDDAAAREPREPAPDGAAGTSAAAPTAERPEPEERANAPVEDTAGAGALRDRSNGARSNLVAGTVTLGVGGATAAPGAAVLEDGDAPARDAARLDGGGSAAAADAERLSGGDPRENVREMMKILNLRESDASRLDISGEDFARLWRGDADAPGTLVDDVAARLGRMLG